MSISTQKSIPREITRDRIVRKTAIKKITEVAKSFIIFDPVNTLFLLAGLITAIGAALGQDIDWKWYGFLLIVTVVFFLDKFDIINKKTKEPK